VESLREAGMPDRIPTQIGDVLILHNSSIPTHGVGAISEDGQQHLKANISYERGRTAAEAAARSLVMPGCRIYTKNTDTGHWAELD
jgi:hypothetical protein